MSDRAIEIMLCSVLVVVVLALVGLASLPAAGIGAALWFFIVLLLLTEKQDES